MRLEPHPDRWGTYTLFYAKLNSGPSNVVAVKRVRTFYVGQAICYSPWCELECRSTSLAPKWYNGKVWKIESNRLYIEKR